MAKIGLVPMAAKPYHAGHDMLVRLASKENDEVLLFVSLSDRDDVSGEAMSQIWKMIEPTLPANVKVTYGGSPVRHVFDVLGSANEKNSPDVFSIYSDPTDVQENYKTLSKYAGNLINNGQIKLRGISRQSTVNVSGTKMRQWLATGDKTSFVKHLPQSLNGDKVWDILSTTKPQAKPIAKKAAKKAQVTTTEGLLRSYIRMLIG